MVCARVGGEEGGDGAGEPVAFVGRVGAAPGVLDGGVQGGPEGEGVPDAGFEEGLELRGCWWGGGEEDAAAWGRGYGGGCRVGLLGCHDAAV